LISLSKKIVLQLVNITNSKIISDLSDDTTCKQKFNDIFRLDDNYKL